MRRIWPVLWIGGLLAFMYLPFVPVFLGSFSSQRYIRFPPAGFSTRWYADITAQHWAALGTSLLIAVLTTGISCILGTTVALALARGHFRLGNWLAALFQTPLQAPNVALGVVFLTFYHMLARITGWRLMETVGGLVLAHVVFTFPYVIGAVAAMLDRFDTNLELAAAGLGARRWSIFRRVTLPLIMPGVFAGGFYAFITSFGNVQVSVFLTGAKVTTLPVVVFQQLEYDFSPTILAISTLVVAISLLAVALVNRFVGLSRILNAQAQ